MNAPLWQTHDLKDGLTVRAGNALWSFRTHQGDCLWHLERTEEQEEATVATGAPPFEERDWKRWASGGHCTQVILRPALADRSLVARPRFPLNLAPQESIQVFVGMPLWLQARSGAAAEAPAFIDQPILELSKTWFGTPIAGERAYQLRTKALRQAADILPLPAWRAICPLTIANRGRQPLPIDRICIKCPSLDLYADEQGYCSGEVHAEITDNGTPAAVEHRPGPPRNRPQAKLVQGARQPVKGLFHQLTVAAHLGR